MENQNGPINESIRNIEVSLNQLTDSFKKVIEEVSISFDPLKEAINSLVSKISDFQQFAPESFSLLASYGWYPSIWLEFKEINAISEFLKNGSIEEVDLLMKTHVTEIYHLIKSDLIRNFPNREKALNEAFWAHENQKYFLSVPVFLSQADGICKELLNVSLFGGKKNKNSENKYEPHTKQWINEFTSDTFVKCFLEPLKHKIGFNLFQGLPKPNGLITRHEILHGENSSYGTELQSFRALSLLFFVSDILKEAKSFDDSREN